MRKLCGLLAAVFVFALLLPGCKQEQVSNDMEKYLAGFQTEGELTGGIAFDNANLRESTVAYTDTDAKLTLKFQTGSRLSGTADEGTAHGVPPYRVYILPSPSRLAIEIEGLKYWDYTRSIDLGGGFITGCFQQNLSYTTAAQTAGAEGDTGDGTENEPEQKTVSVIYFQLNCDAAFWASAAGDTLTVDIRSIPTVEAPVAEDAAADVTGGRKFYVVANAYADFCDGTLTPKPDMTPTLANDGKTVLLISEQFASEGLASQFMSETLAVQENAISSQWSVIALKDNEQPPMDEDTIYKEVYGEQTARTNGASFTPDVLIKDGIFLTVTPDKKGCLYSRRTVETGVGESAYKYEQVYIHNNTEDKNLLRYKFDTVEQAKYSPDGRRLAVLAREAESAHLYIFDMDTNELMSDLSAVGFGDTISSFTWDDTGSAIYAVGGSSAIQVHKYDFSVPDETKRHSLVDRSADEGSVAYCNGEIYFVETDMETGPAIYRIKPDGGIRKKFMTGSSFMLSGNSKYMAINASLGDFYAVGAEGAAQSENKFIVYDMINGEEKLVTDQFAVYDYIWSLDGTKLFYFENKLSGGSNEGASSDDTDTADDAAAADPFPYTLWVYDVASGQSRTVCDLPYTSIAASADGASIYLCYYDGETSGEVIRATYSIPLS